MKRSGTSVRFVAYLGMISRNVGMVFTHRKNATGQVVSGQKESHTNGSKQSYERQDLQELHGFFAYMMPHKRMSNDT